MNQVESTMSITREVRSLEDPSSFEDQEFEITITRAFSNEGIPSQVEAWDQEGQQVFLTAQEERQAEEILDQELDAEIGRFNSNEE